MVINGNIIARALAILLVVMNHAVNLPFGGGMTFLLMLAGYNFAKFSFQKENRLIIKDLYKTTLKIVLPCMVVIILNFILFDNIRWQELLMFSNYIDNERVVAFPVWYAQVVLQLAILLTLPIAAFNFSYFINQRPRFITLCTLFASLALWLFTHSNYDGLAHLPYFYLWNFVLGWVLWAFLRKNHIIDKTNATIIVCLAMSFVFLLFGHNVYRFIIILGLSIIFIWVDRVELWAFPAKLLTLMANAILVLFLFHHWGFEIFYLIAESIEGRVYRVILKVIFSVTFCILLWAFLSACYTSFNKSLTYKKT